MVIVRVTRYVAPEAKRIPPPAFAVDGAYEYTDDDLACWDADGPGATFRKHYAADYDLAVSYGLDPAQRPRPSRQGTRQ